MWAQVVIIYLFQSAYGVLYGRIGIIMAGFMAGLFAGSLLCRRRHSEGLAFGLLCALALLGGALPHVLGVFTAGAGVIVSYGVFLVCSGGAGDRSHARHGTRMRAPQRRRPR